MSTFEAPASEAFEMMGRDDLDQVGVVSGGRLEGVVTRADILNVLRIGREIAG